MGQMDAAILSGIAAVLAALSIGFALGRYIWSAKPKLDPVELATLQAEAASLKQERDKLNTDCEKLSVEMRTANTRVSEAREENARLAERIAGLSRQALIKQRLCE